VSNIVIPYTYQNINSFNDSMGLGISGVNYPITLTHGNYTASSFDTMLATQLGATVTFTGSVSATTGQLTITGSSGIAFSITGDQFLGTLNNSTRYTSANNVLTLPYPINLAGTQFIDVRCDIALNSSNSHDSNRFILARVPINTTPFNTIYYTDESFGWCNCGVDTINNINLSLVNQWGHQLNLQNFDWEVSLEISSNNV
jgi:hypothetical protein